ncbi:zinc-dependent alcohol dehydrogenase family protein [Thermodesulforhabdus norvegica]|uniref:alcohol dehydrogenase n=1 Tax=Thermodesulforhabdus norvegica TaxID=39841 RepID=A0A1I4T4V3_9BACT|nr:zinc-dependent alcohol dehydrogenase family protein [Thermodesulforhabdus norvegica]SFM71788.1 alcohol dehydrogenase, propanol-preferring [Thermodesulforhabdus norvegica]
MKAMVLRSCAPVESFPLKMEILPDPEPGPGEIRVKVEACGICRTDLHVIEGELPPRDHPVIPGHQIVGRVDMVGPGTQRFSRGDRVGIAWLRHTCGKCKFCLTDRENLCESQLFTGYHEPGGYAEYALVNENFAYRVPEELSAAEVAPLLCAGIIGYRALKRSGCKPGDSIALFGFGSSAHIVMQILNFWKCRVFVVSRGSKHQELARTMGAYWVGSSAKEIPEKVSSAIIFAPAGHLVKDALECLEKGGTLSLAGIYMTPIPGLDYERHLFYEKNIHSVTANTRKDGEELLVLAGQIPIKPHIQTYPFEKANEALCDLKADRIQGSGVLVMSS